LLDGLPPSPEVDASLRDLVFINRYLGGWRILRSVFRQLEHPGAQFTVADIGAASGDMGAGLRSAFPKCSVVSVDRIWHHLRAAADPRVAADAFAPPFRERSFDYVTCSLFLHHFEDRELPTLLARLLGMARRALVVIDLERTTAGLALMPLFGVLFRWSALTRHDAVLSMESALTAGELGAFAAAAGASEIRVRRHPIWLRVSLVARP
jgi:hypothetical protein